MGKLFSFDYLIVGLLIISGIVIKSTTRKDLREPVILKQENKKDYSKYDSIVEAFDCYIDNTIAYQQLPGAAVCIIKDNQILLQKCYGVKTYGTNDSINEHTVFRLGSVSKGFASILTGILVNEKSFHWDDTVKKYVPDFNILNNNFENQITVRHILSQTTGLPKHTFTDMLDVNVPYEVIKPQLCSIPSISVPGQVYSYQNVVYSLIADVMKASTGKDYSLLMQEKIFDPLEMCDASTDYFTFASNENIALPHIKMKNGTWLTEKINGRYYSVAPAAGINASIHDMANWMMALLGNNTNLIDTSILNTVFKPEIRCMNRYQYKRNWKNLDKAYYGMGWRVFEYNGVIIVYHGGYVRGYKSEIALIPNENVGIVMLTNAASNIPDKSVPIFIDDYLAVTLKN